GLVRAIDLERVVAAARQLLDLLIRQVGDESEQLGVPAEKVLADVRPRLDGVLLHLAVDDFAHPFDEEARRILGEQRVPVAAPDNLDDVPAGAAEGGLEFLDYLAIAADRAVEALQVAIDDEDQVVELFAAGERH